MFVCYQNIFIFYVKHMYVGVTCLRDLMALKPALTTESFLTLHSDDNRKPPINIFEGPH